VISTAIDYAVMVACVEFAGIGPVPATAIGALGGAITNFTVNRTFTYRAASVAMRRQVWRFGLVSAASLGLNTLGEYLLHSLAGLHYFPARVITSVIVSNAWNYPMLRFFVFSDRTARA
jgi:putative flippase GtrA